MESLRLNSSKRKLKRRKFCKCGCGAIVKRTFKHSHYAKTQCGIPRSLEVGIKVSYTKKNSPHPMRGKHLPDWWKKKIKEGWFKFFDSLNEEEKIVLHKKRSYNQKGERCSNWQGGKSFELYGVEFNYKLKEEIRSRDGYICQLCYKKQNKRKHDVHHIDFNKRNNKKKNLVTLCRNCHAKTSRDFNFTKERKKNFEQYIKQLYDK